MRRFGPLLIVVGVLVLLSGVELAATPVALATTQAPLPDRPTLTPAPAATATATAAPVDEGDGGRRDEPPGRITGTVIDLTTGAPAPGIPVAVGDAVVTTDDNGNYDRSGLPAGAYGVELRLPAGRGEPAQGAVRVELRAGSTVVQHLAFRGPAVQVPTVEAPVAPTLAALTPTAASVVPTPAVPAELPRTGGADGAPAFAVGLLLIVCGAGLSLAGRRP